MQPRDIKDFHDNFLPKATKVWIKYKEDLPSSYKEYERNSGWHSFLGSACNVVRLSGSRDVVIVSGHGSTYGYYLTEIFGAFVNGKWYTEPGFIPKTFTDMHKGHWVRQKSDGKWVEIYSPETFNRAIACPTEYSIDVPNYPANEFLHPHEAKSNPKSTQSIKVGDWAKCAGWTSWHKVTSVNLSDIGIQGCRYNLSSVTEVWPAENGDPNKYEPTTLRVSGSVPNQSNFPKSNIAFKDIKPGMWVKLKELPKEKQNDKYDKWRRTWGKLCGTWQQVESVNPIMIKNYNWYGNEIEAISEHSPLDVKVITASDYFYGKIAINITEQKGEYMITQKDLDEMKNFDPANLKKVKEEVDKDFSTRQQQIAREKYQSIKNELEQVNLEIKNLSDRKNFLEEAVAAFG